MTFGSRFLGPVSNENGAVLLRFLVVFARLHDNANQEKRYMVASVQHFGYSRSSGLAHDRVFLMTSPFSDSIVFSLYTGKQRFQKASFSNRSTLESVF